MAFVKEKREIGGRITQHLPTLGVLLLAGCVLGVWLFFTPPGLLGKADAIGYAVCHRIDLRSLHIGERALPLCSRCTGTYLGVSAALLYLGLRRPRASGFPTKRAFFALGIFCVAFAVDGLNSYLHFFPGAPVLYTSTNLLRLITGTYFGMVLATITYAGFNQSAWQSPVEVSVLPSLWDLLAYLAIGAGVILLAWTEIPLILYPLALLSSGAVFLMFVLVYTMLAILVLRRENQANKWRDLLLPLGLGVIFAMAQIGVIDALRYFLMGTWGGFQL